MSRRKRTSCAPPLRTTTATSRYERERRLLDERDERTQELGAVRAVDRAVVAGERDVHHRRDVDLAVDDDGRRLHGADGQDRHLRRVEHGDELVDAEHAEVRDRERAAAHVLPRQLAVAGTADELGARARDLLHAAPVGVANHGNDEPARRRDRDADVRARDGGGSRPRRASR